MVSLFNKFKSAAPTVPAPAPVAAPTPVPAPTVTAPSATRRPQIQDEEPSVDALKAQIAQLQAKQAAQNAAVSVLPPDAPKSKPELAADPVEGFNPIPAPLKQTRADATGLVTVVQTAPAEEKKKGGRPPGAKNKKTTGEAPVAESMEEDFEVTEITVTAGATVKRFPNDPKCYEFIRSDITLRAVVRKGVNLDAVREKLSLQAEAGLAEDLARMLTAE